MKKIATFLVAFLCFQFALAQETVSDDPDMPYKLELYNKYKNEVRRFTHKDFDDYFLEYFTKLNQPTLLTREEYYTYTIKISIYSEKLGLLYKDRREESKKSKAEWFSKKYSDYLSSRQTKKN